MTESNNHSSLTLAEFIPLEALAKSLGVSKATVSRWRAELGLPGIRVGIRVYFHEPSVARWLKAQETVRKSDD